MGVCSSTANIDLHVAGRPGAGRFGGEGAQLHARVRLCGGCVWVRVRVYVSVRERESWVGARALAMGACVCMLVGCEKVTKSGWVSERLRASLLLGAQQRRAHARGLRTAAAVLVLSKHEHAWRSGWQGEDDNAYVSSASLCVLSLAFFKLPRKLPVPLALPLALALHAQLRCVSLHVASSDSFYLS